MSDVTVPRADVEAAVDALQYHWDECGGTRVHDEEPLLALLPVDAVASAHLSGLPWHRERPGLHPRPYGALDAIDLPCEMRGML